MRSRSPGLMVLAGLGLLANPHRAQAQDIHFAGFVDLRLTAAGNEAAWDKGGLGKLRYGGGGVDPHLGAIVLVPSIRFTPELTALADIRADPHASSNLGVTEGFIRWRPVSTTPWRWSIRAGAFFPPVSYENNGLGWTSPWTVTPSAINSWIGEEVRIIGGEFREEYRTDYGIFDTSAAVFGANNTAGTLLALRGWSLSDTITPLGGTVRLANAIAGLNQVSRINDEIDNKIGWYVEAGWTLADYGKLSITRYDNSANTQANLVNSPWHTEFWNLAAERDFGDINLIAQGMTGSTAVATGPGVNSVTRFYAGSLLLGWNFAENWRAALRVDEFGTDGFMNSSGGEIDDSEHGRALTADLGWRPQPWLRLNAELVEIASNRNARLQEGISPKQAEAQTQLVARVIF